MSEMSVRHQTSCRFLPEARDHLGEADDLLDAVGDQVGQVGQHGQLGVLLVGVGAAGAAVLVHHQQVAQVHLGVHRLCSKDRRREERSEAERRKQLKGNAEAEC